MCSRRALLLMLTLLACSRLTGHAAEKPLAERFTTDIQPILVRKCYSCHGPEKQKGALDLSTFPDYGSVTNSPDLWQVVLERVQAYEMPPKAAGELSYDEQQKMMTWLRALPKSVPPDCSQLASDRTANFYRGYVMSRRLNRDEYQRSLRDLLGVEPPVADLLPADGGGGEGFDTTGSALFLSPVHIERYLEAAEISLALALPDRARRLSPERRAARDRLLPVRPGRGVSPREAAAQNLALFARRAFRRAVDPAEVEHLMGMYDHGIGKGDTHVAALRLAYQAVLISPHFLFLAEPEPAEGGIQPLPPFPLASRLSYFLWSSMPDDRLLELAESGQLRDPEVLRAEVKRMLADPRAAALGERFAMQWLDLERLGHELRPDAARFPEYTDDLGNSMRREVVEYFNHVFREDRPLTDLLDSDYTFVDARLATLYGLEAPAEEGFQRVAVGSRTRGGLLGMAGIHAATSYPLRTSPVLRGRWILEVILGDKVPPPPPGVPPLEEAGAGAAAQSLRQQLELHRTKAECAACHDRMDPLGFGLENFDVLGRWRDADRGQPIDARGTVPSGESFDGPTGLKDFLMARKDKVLRHLTRKVTGFAFGRELNEFDNCVIDRAMAALATQGYRPSVLIESIVTSFPFQHRFHPKTDA